MSTQTQAKCIECGSTNSQQNRLRWPVGDKWALCTKCLQKQALRINQQKKDKANRQPQIGMIIPGLYLGNHDAAIDPQIIQKYKISAICACGSYLMTPFQKQKFEGQFEQILYQKYHIADYLDENISHFFDQNSKWIDQRLKQGRNILVHCSAGRSRSASFVIAYLIKYFDMKYLQALQFVKSRRKSINPNQSFRVQLKEYRKSVCGKQQKQQYDESYIFGIVKEHQRIDV